MIVLKRLWDWSKGEECKEPHSVWRQQMKIKEEYKRNKKIYKEMITEICTVKELYNTPDSTIERCKEVIKARTLFDSETVAEAIVILYGKVFFDLEGRKCICKVVFEDEEIEGKANSDKYTAVTNTIKAINKKV